MTTIHLLHRPSTRGVQLLPDLEATATVEEDLSKVKRVRDWVLNFVGGQAVGAGKEVGRSKKSHSQGPVAQETLPPDTQ